MPSFYKLLLASCFLAFLFPLNAQELGPCGTHLGVSPWLRDFQNRMHSLPRTNDVLYLPLQVHVVGTDNGSGRMSRDGVFKAFCTLNEDFVQADIQFFMANPINYIDNSAYYEHDFEVGYEMMVSNNFSNVINCYIVNSPAGNCGYYFPGAPDAIALSRNCTGPNDHTWAHEVGHYLSLPHPFFGWEGTNHDYSQPAPDSWDFATVEKLDGSNCSFAADGFCDTTPDYLDYRWNCNSSGTSNVTQTDPNGETFVSNGTLFMSYSNPSCKGVFSPDQIAAMRANVEEERPNLFTIPPNPEEIVIQDVEDINVITPQEGTLPEGETVTLSWDPVPNATNYIVQVNPFSFFSVVFNEFIVSDNSVEVSGLLSDRDYYWRIRPYNAYNTCTTYSNATSFTTGTITSSQELLAGESLQLYPNPARENRVKLRLQTEATTSAHWQLSDSRGRLQQSGSFETGNGQTEQSLDVQHLTAGIYFLRIQLEDRQTVRKLIIY